VPHLPAGSASVRFFALPLDGHTLILHEGSACFAALFAKVGVEHVGSDFATFIRTSATQEWQSFGSVSPRSHEPEARRQREGGV
jgi:hypothetical protein